MPIVELVHIVDTDIDLDLCSGWNRVDVSRVDPKDACAVDSVGCLHHAGQAYEERENH